MASATASGTVAAVALLAICLVVLLLLRHFLPLRSAPAYLLVPIFLSLALPASAVLLVPIDLASSGRTQEEASKGIWLPERMMLVSWRIVYWLTFVLTWVLLPLLGEYMDAGYREPRARFIYSLRANGRYQLIVLACAVAGLVYMVISYGFDFTAIRSLVMALAYFWGLVLAIYLMGHGLVAVPRRLLRNASVSGRLRRIQGQAPRVHEALEDAVASLQALEAQVLQLKQRKTGTARDFQQWIDDLVEVTESVESRPVAGVELADASATIPAVITDRYLADLTRRLSRARHQRARYVEAWDRLVQDAAHVQAILDSKASQKLDAGRSSRPTSRFMPSTILTPYLRYHLHAHLIPAGRMVAGVVLSTASIAVLWSEIIKVPAPHLSAVSLTVIHHPSNQDYQIGFGGQLTAAGWICYMCACAVSSFNDVPVWNQRALVHRNTSGESACWYAGQVAKLTVPLAYNFLTFLPRDIHTHTTFYHFLGRLINLTPLGTGFDYFFPLFILLPVCATLFNLYGRIKNVLGFGILEDEDPDNPSGFGTGGWLEGRDLIARDLHGQAPVALGLQDSPRPSHDTPRRPGAAPPRWVPPGERPASQRAAAPVSRRARSSQPDVDPDDDDEDNFFAAFGRRIKNTVDTIERPKWMQSANTDVSIKRPKWLGGGSSNTSRGPITL